MYTQCPECSTAFRVTAEVLRQAAGKVRCGGCGNAFNALEHLSEEKPESPRSTPPAGAVLPGLDAEARHAGADSPPDAPGSVAGVAAGESLEEYPGDEDGAAEDRTGKASLLDAALVADLESRRVDEVLAESHTPVDEVLSADGDAGIDSPEVFAPGAGRTIPDEELRFDDNTGLPDDYDADDDSEPVIIVPEPSRDAPQPMASLDVDLGFNDPGEWQDLLDEVEPGDDTAERTFAEELEALDLGDIEDDEVEESPDEVASRMEALSVELSGIYAGPGEIGTPTDETTIIDELEALDLDLETDNGESAVEEEAATSDPEPEATAERHRGDAPGEDPVDGQADDGAAADSGEPEASPDIEPEGDAVELIAVGEDDNAGPRSSTADEDAAAPGDSADAVADAEDDAETAIDEQDVVDEQEAETKVSAQDDAAAEDVSAGAAGAFSTDEIGAYIAAAEARDAAELEDESPDAGETLHDEVAADRAAGDDGTGVDEDGQSPDDESDRNALESRGDDARDATPTTDVATGEDDMADGAEPACEDSAPVVGDESATAEDAVEDDLAAAIELFVADDDAGSGGADEPDDADVDAAAEEAAASEIEIELDNDSTARAGSDEPSIDDDLFAAAFESEVLEDDNAPAEPVLTPMTEEEQTINMMIDQELLAVAITDEDGLASTIVGSKESFDAAIASVEAEGNGARQEAPDRTVETIIMSGESAESLSNMARAEALKEEAAALIAAAKAEEEPEHKNPVNWRLAGALIGLGVLLALQAIHFSRDTLAKVPAFRAVLGPVYEVVGKPLAPAWEVTGWRVEKTNGSVNAAGDTLSIYTEVGNRSGAPLPYPVIGVSLLDRFEESIGSRIFEPEEYLPGDVDRLAVVETGVTFNARMQIESPAVAASGFRLNVCYREDGESLRCAIEDFR